MVDVHGADPVKITKFDPNYPWKLGDTTMAQGGGVSVVTGDSGSTGGAPIGPAGGDLSGAFPDPTVVGIGGTPVDALPAVATKYLNGDGHWTTPPGSGSSGGLVLLEQHTAAASATLDFTTAITSTCDEYMIEFLGIVPATNSVDLLLRVSTDGGSTYDSGTNYYRHNVVAGSGFSIDDASGQTAIALDYVSVHISNSTAYTYSGSMRLALAQSGAAYPIVLGQVAYQTNEPKSCIAWVNGIYQVAGAAINALRFLMSSGNIASGTIRVYGIAKV